jgi:hypothetical protein
MTVSIRSKLRVRSMAASLAIALFIAAGCHQEEEAPTSAPPSPLPTSDSSRPVQPKPPRTDQGGETKTVGQVERDLRKDLASPVIKPDGPTTTFPPAGKPEPTKSDTTKSGQP